ncbi:MAG TPA: MaoC family dehydratase N-terminal domain-containing protein [Casimicrobiaceae bacterium]|nr:MaoC family dehydratase N-terminal domain-containing protein [Casimicrobiaceae bacterium]
MDDALTRWVGRQETATDEITATPLAALAATLDRDPVRPPPGTPIPPLAHWLYFLPLHCQSTLGDDGHAERGGFLPPIDLPRRMWAASRFRFLAPLRVGDTVQRVSTIAAITPKQGRTGPLVFVRVDHRIVSGDRVAIEESHDIVYRGAAGADERAAPAAAAPGNAQWRREIRPDAVLLFRYSALTFNGHRIHYDRSYVTGVEGYPGLVVHGPLMGTLLIDALCREAPGAQVARYAFKALRPVFDTTPFFVCGRRDGASAALWIADAHGGLCMEATAELQ